MNQKYCKSKWDKISSKSKLWHTLVHVPIIRMIPVVLIGSWLIESINIASSVKSTTFVGLYLPKLIIAYILGVIIGSLEWDLMRAITFEECTDERTIKRRYILVYGILHFGGLMFLINISPGADSWRRVAIGFFIYLIAGYICGYITTKWPKRMLSGYEETMDE